MQFTYYEDGWGALCFEAIVYPFSLMLSEKIPLLFLAGLN